MLLSDVRYGFLPTAPASVPAQNAPAPAAPPPANGTSESSDPVDRVEISGVAAEAAASVKSGLSAEVESETEEEDETELSEEEEAQVKELKARDDEVRAHEAAHAAAGGSFAGSPSYEYQTGPDGKRYAVGGEVSIDTSPIKGDPQASVDKLRQVQAAALAPAEPSGQDKKVAQQAAAALREAQAELSAQSREEFQERTGQTDETSEVGNANAPELPGAPEAETSQEAPQTEGTTAATEPRSFGDEADLGGFQRSEGVRNEGPTRQAEQENASGEETGQTGFFPSGEVQQAAAAYQKIASLV